MNFDSKKLALIIIGFVALHAMGCGPIVKPRINGYVDTQPIADAAADLPAPIINVYNVTEGGTGDGNCACDSDNAPAGYNIQPAAMHLEYAIDKQGTSNMAFVGVLHFVARTDRVALRRLKIKTDRALPSVTLDVYNQTTGQHRYATASGPNTTFDVVSPASLDLGFVTKADDHLIVYAYIDASGLDSQTVRFSIDEMEISVNGDAAMVSTSGLPITFSVPFAEYPQLSSTAYISSRAELRNTQTTLAEFEISNHGIKSTDILSIQFQVPADGLKGVVNLKAVFGNMALAFPNDGDSYSGQSVEFNLTNSDTVIPAGGRLTVRVVGDTVTSAENLTIFATWILAQPHNDSLRAIYSWGPMDHQTNGWLPLTTALTGADNEPGSLASLWTDRDVSVRSTGPVDGTNPVMLVEITNNAESHKELRSLRFTLDSDDTAIAGNMWLVVDGLAHHGAPIAVGRNVQLSVPVTLAPGERIVIRIYAQLPNAGTADTVQFKLTQVHSSHGLLEDDLSGISILIG